jgi:hypothetical protein
MPWCSSVRAYIPADQEVLVRLGAECEPMSWSGRAVTDCCGLKLYGARIWRKAIVLSVYRLATGWTVRESNPDGGETFRTHPDQPRGPPSLL